MGCPYLDLCGECALTSSGVKVPIHKDGKCRILWDGEEKSSCPYYPDIQGEDK